MRKCFWVVAFLTGFAGYCPASDCADNPKKFRHLKGRYNGKIGYESVLIFPCDTMIVPAGKQVVINGNSFLHFLTPSNKNIIIVDGSLEIKNGYEPFTTISSAVDSSSGKLRAAASSWQGFWVRARGKLTLKSVKLYGARIPIRSESEDVHINRSHFIKSEFMTYRHNFLLFFNQSPAIKRFRFEQPNTTYIGRHADIVFFPVSETHMVANSRSAWYIVSGGIILGSSLTALLIPISAAK